MTNSPKKALCMRIDRYNADEILYKFISIRVETPALFPIAVFEEFLLDLDLEVLKKFCDLLPAMNKVENFEKHINGEDFIALLQIGERHYFLGGAILILSKLRSSEFSESTTQTEEYEEQFSEGC